MGEFNFNAALLIVIMGSLFMSLVFFADAIMINFKSKEKNWTKESRIATMWGFAFMLLGHLGNYYTTG